MDTLWHDIRFGARTLVRNPGFAVVAILSLALGIGPNIAIFTLVDAFLLRPFPVRNLDSLVRIQAMDRNTGSPKRLSYLNYLDIVEQSEAFSVILAEGRMGLNLRSGGSLEPIQATAVSENYFRVLGVAMEAGRSFSAEDCERDPACAVVVLSGQFWDRYYGSDPKVVGTQIVLNGHSFTVVGITFGSFIGTDKLLGLFGSPAIWFPLKAVRLLVPRGKYLDRETGWLSGIGLLQLGLTLDQATANVQVVARGLAREFPQVNENLGINLRYLRDGNPIIRQAAAGMSVFLFIVVCLVFLAACANVANLLLARGSARRQEFAIRAVFGAGRWRLGRQLFFENLLLSFLGGGAGLLLAVWTMEMVATLNLPVIFLQTFASQMNARVLLFTFLLSLATAFVFGLSPALQMSRIDLMASLRGDSGSARSDHRSKRRRNQLVAVQIAVSVVLLSSTGLFLRGLQFADEVDPGFQTENLLVATLALGSKGYSDLEAKTFYDALSSRLRLSPAIRQVGFSHSVPLDVRSPGLTKVYLEGQDGNPSGSMISARYSTVTPEYFKVLGIPILYGRNFDEKDSEGGLGVGIINGMMAQRFWPEGGALGKRFRLSPNDSYLTVIGVAKDSKYRSLGETFQPFIYLPFRQHPASVMRVLLRTAGDPVAALPVLRAEVSALDKTVVLASVKTGRALMEAALRPMRLAAMFFGTLGGLAMILAVLGIYGVVSYNVLQRTHEFGIRMALGASGSGILRLTFTQILKPIVAGLGIGFVMAVIVAQVLSVFVFGVAPFDLFTLVMVSVILVGAAVGAGFFPARRAMKLDPMVVLRYE